LILGMWFNRDFNLPHTTSARQQDGGSTAAEVMAENASSVLLKESEQNAAVSNKATGTSLS